jgi:transposase
VKRPDNLPEDHHCAWREWAEVLEERVDTLEARLAVLERHVFGRRSEKLPAIKDQLRVGNGRNGDAAQERRRENAEKRAELPERLIHHRVPDDKRVCPKCGGKQLRPLGEGKTSTVYEHIAEHFERQVHVQEALACRCGEGIVTAEPPPKVVDKGQYGPGFVAHLITAKCGDSLPLYRLEKRYLRIGVPIARATMVEQFHRAAELLAPISNQLLAEIAASELVQADETPLKVQAKGKCRTSYLWTFLAGKNIAYRYSPSRSGETAQKLLGGTKGALVVDAYTGYNSVVTPEGRVRVGCWAHVRRRFFDSLSTAPAAQQMLDLILALYRVEHEALALGVVRTPEHLAMRRTRSRVTVDQIKGWLDDNLDAHPPKSPIGVAIRYAINQWEALTRFLEQPQYPLDNNSSERALRVVALGRKNFLFIGHDEAGQNIAGLYSLVATCEAHGVNPLEYLKDVLLRVQSHPKSKIAELLPNRWRSTPTSDSS